MHKVLFLSTLFLAGPLLPGCQVPRRALRTGSGEVPWDGSDTLRPPAPPESPAGSSPKPVERQAQGSPWLFGLSPSFLPNLGLTGTVAREVGHWRRGALAFEGEFTDQFLDDKSLTESSDPAAGDWTQAKLGLRWAKAYDRGRWFTLRTGGVWFKARGRPNIIDDPGDYYGIYVELGLEAQLSEHWIVGPAVSTMLVLDEDNHQEHVVPMVTWRFLYRP